MHSRGVITLLAIYKIPKLKYVFARRSTPVDLPRVHYHRGTGLKALSIVYIRKG